MFNDKIKSFIQCGVQSLISVFACFDALNENKYFTDCVSDSAKLSLCQKLPKKETALVLAHHLVLESDKLSSTPLPFGELNLNKQVIY